MNRSAGKAGVNRGADATERCSAPANGRGAPKKKASAKKKTASKKRPATKKRARRDAAAAESASPARGVTSADIARPSRRPLAEDVPEEASLPSTVASTSSREADLDALHSRRSLPSQAVPMAEEDPWEGTRNKAPLERRVEMGGGHQETYLQNFKERRKHEVEVNRHRESHFASSWQGRLQRFWFSRWLFNRETRRLEGLSVLGLGLAVLGVTLSTMVAARELRFVSEDFSVTEGRVPGRGEVLLEGRETSWEALSRFFEASSVEAIMDLVRHPEVVRPLVQKWYQTHGVQPRFDYSLESLTWVREAEGRRFYLYDVRFSDQPEPRRIAVERTSGGAYLVDWEMAVGYQAMGWEEFRRERPVAPVYLRVMVEPSDYYNFEYDDEVEWTAYRLFHPEEDASLFGYVSRYSPLDRRLETGTSMEAQEYILKLRFPENAQSGHAVSIEGILQEEWERVYAKGERHFDLPQEAP